MRGAAELRVIDALVIRVCSTTQLEILECVVLLVAQLIFVIFLILGGGALSLLLSFKDRRCYRTVYRSVSSLVTVLVAAVLMVVMHLTMVMLFELADMAALMVHIYKIIGSDTSLKDAIHWDPDVARFELLFMLLRRKVPIINITVEHIGVNDCMERPDPFMFLVDSSMLILESPVKYKLRDMDEK